MKKIRYLALGDSYTIGEAVSFDLSFPGLLKTQLEHGGYSVVMDVIAQTGWTTDELMAVVDSARLVQGYQLLTLLIGVNNQYRGRPVDEYSSQFFELLNRAIELANGYPSRVIVISIPDWGVTPFAQESARNIHQISKDIDEFNDENQRLSIQKNVHYVDITPISRRAREDTHLLAGDGLHPSSLMYAEWVKKIFPVALSALSGQNQQNGSRYSSI